MATDVDTIVRRLNEVLKPDTDWTLVSFDELRGRELSKVLNDVCTVLLPEMKVDVASEDPAEVGQRHFDFLTSILQYRLDPPADQNLLPGLTQGEPRVIRPVLLWILGRMPENEQRIYLSKYLIPVDVPPDVRATTEGLQELWDAGEALRGAFKELHKTCEKLRKTGSAPEEIVGATQDKMRDAEQLREQLAAVKKRFEATGMQRNPKFLEAARKTRAAENDQRKAKEAMEGQTAKLRDVDKQLTVLALRLQQAEKDAKDSNVGRLLARMTDDVSAHETLLRERLPKDIDGRREQAAHLDAVLNTRVDIEAEKQAVLSLTSDIKALEAKHRPKLGEKEEQSVAIHRQQAQLVAKRRATAQEELDRLEGELLQADEARAEKERSLDGFRGARVLVGEEFQEFANAIRLRMENYQRRNAEIQELRGEYGVLLKTIEILKTSDDAMEAFVTQLEERSGVKGARKVAEDAAAAAERRAQAEELKGKTLDELSKIVEEFVEQTRQKRGELTPRILKYREMRQRHEEVEAVRGQTAEYMEQKAQYEGARAVLMAELSKIVRDLDTAADEVASVETTWHTVNMQLSLLAVQSNRVEAETQYRSGNGAFGPTNPTFEDALSKEIRNLEQQTRDLREKKRDVDENHQHHAQQVLWFRSLKRLLDTKLLVQKQDVQRGQAAAMVVGGEKDYLRIDHDDGEADGGENSA